MDIPLVIFFPLPLFAFLGFHSLVSVLNSTSSRSAVNTASDSFSAVPFASLSPSNLPLFLSVHPASCFSPNACDLGWQFLSSERSASLFLRSALILPTNRRGAPPTERLFIG